jgi:hypothetical protein
MKSETVRLIALGREGSRQVYGTRRLVAGDEFEMPRGLATVLIAIGKAKLAGGEPSPAPSPPKPPPPAPVREPPPQEPEEDEPDEEVPPYPRPGTDEVATLRTQARDLGIVVDGRWGPARLRYEMARHRR